MYGLYPGIAPGSTSVNRSLRQDARYFRCYFPCVPGFFQLTATPTYAVRFDPSCALSHRVFSVFNIWFLKIKYSLDFDKIKKRR